MPYFEYQKRTHWSKLHPNSYKCLCFDFVKGYTSMHNILLSEWSVRLLWGLRIPLSSCHTWNIWNVHTGENFIQTRINVYVLVLWRDIHILSLGHNQWPAETVTDLAVDAHNFTRQAEIITSPMRWRTKPSTQSHMLEVPRKRQKDTEGKR